VINALRETTAGPGVDRFMAPEIEATVQFVATGAALRAAETVTGPLN
jgi:histidine ammonia-lyase